MKQYLITGYDYTDEGALDRRMNARQQHLDGAKRLKHSGNFVLGGAMLNDDGKMIGSTLVLQFESDSELQVWKETEIYILANVWETVDIKPFKVANI